MVPADLGSGGSTGEGHLHLGHEIWPVPCAVFPEHSTLPALQQNSADVMNDSQILCRVSYRTKLSLLLEGVLWEPGSLGHCTSIASAKGFTPLSFVALHLCQVVSGFSILADKLVHPADLRWGSWK